MARFYGKIGYSETVETSDGVWTEKYVERFYYGDITRNSRRLESGDNLNDNIVIDNIFSIVADAYAYEHFFAIKYVEWMGMLWKVTNVQVERPRLTLTVGGVYNGDTSGTA